MIKYKNNEEINFLKRNMEDDNFSSIFIIIMNKGIN